MSFVLKLNDALCIASCVLLYVHWYRCIPYRVWHRHYHMHRWCALLPMVYGYGVCSGMHSVVYVLCYVLHVLTTATYLLLDAVLVDQHHLRLALGVCVVRVPSPLLLLHRRCAGRMLAGSIARCGCVDRGCTWSAVQAHLSRWCSPRSIESPHSQHIGGSSRLS